MTSTQIEQAPLPTVVPEGSYAPGSPGACVARIYEQVTRAVVLHDDPAFLVERLPEENGTLGSKIEASPFSPVPFDTDALRAQSTLAVQVGVSRGARELFHPDDLQGFFTGMEHIGSMHIASRPHPGVSRAPRYTLELILTPQVLAEGESGLRLAFDYWRNPKGAHAFGEIALGAYFFSTTAPLIARLSLGILRVPEDIQDRPRPGTQIAELPRLLTAIRTTAGIFLKS
jgi:hypothetical protein